MLNRISVTNFVRDLPFTVRVISLFTLITKNKKICNSTPYLKTFFF
ncbi:hypothetical protein FB99_35860 [Pantoea agglomerans]|nr:hypothetical protein FB99_35860 [Pantoea agglomerans]